MPPCLPQRLCYQLYDGADYAIERWDTQTDFVFQNLFVKFDFVDKRHLW